ncbi:hypothetical protein BDQ12DRAFT_6708 [Crucibulum laeve]|uniref:Uncharacterized protein n=1 Tax=Crucibulum laeve TaxID=68775 RepID=A0A5C3MFN1_9AGAR|nr:hypothetical protein BDQ12DRAFT_6708 [Crucibulum laeve]
MSNPYANIFEKIGQMFDLNRIQKGLVISKVQSSIRTFHGLLVLFVSKANTRRASYQRAGRQQRSEPKFVHFVGCGALDVCSVMRTLLRSKMVGPITIGPYADRSSHKASVHNGPNFGILDRTSPSMKQCPRSPNVQLIQHYNGSSMLCYKSIRFSSKCSLTVPIPSIRISYT